MNTGTRTGLTYSQLIDLYWKEDYSKFTKQDIIDDIIDIAGSVPTYEP